MIKILAVAAVSLFLGGVLFSGAAEASAFEEDVFATSAGEVKITFIGHGTLMFTFGSRS